MPAAAATRDGCRTARSRRARVVELLDEQGRDQEAAEDEEDVDADRTCRNQARMGVDAEHQQDCERTETIEARPVSEAVSVDCGH